MCYKGCIRAKADKFRPVGYKYLTDELKYRFFALWQARIEMDLDTTIVSASGRRRRPDIEMKSNDGDDNDDVEMLSSGEQEEVGNVFQDLQVIDFLNFKSRGYLWNIFERIDPLDASVTDLKENLLKTFKKTYVDSGFAVCFLLFIFFMVLRVYM